MIIPSAKQAKSRLVWFYFTSVRATERIVETLNTCFNGIWLGFMTERLVHAIDLYYYEMREVYTSAKYNEQGFMPFEEKALWPRFEGCKSFLVSSAGGGREVLAIRRKGYHADGFECNPILLEAANSIMVKNGFSGDLLVAPHDTCPQMNRKYDALILGWGGYPLIYGRKKRVRFLKQFRESAADKALLLVSFRVQDEHPDFPRRYRRTAFVANVIRLLTFREKVQIGDWLTPTYNHYFSQEEISDELRQAGFEMIEFAVRPHAYAVARAV